MLASLNELAHCSGKDFDGRIVLGSPGMGVQFQYGERKQAAVN